MDVTQAVSALSSCKGLLAVLKKRAVLVALLIIFVVALGLRLYGLAWDQGFAYTPHPDERAILMKVEDIAPPDLHELGLLFDADESPWNPQWFPYGSFPLYLLKGVQIVYGMSSGGEVDDLRLLGRTISAVADATTVVMVFVLGNHIFGRRVGLMASMLVALSVIHIQLSHFYAVDTLLALFVVVAMYFMYKVSEQGRVKDSVVVGIFIGLGLATKVSVLPIVAVFLLAHLIYVVASGYLGPPKASSLGGRLRIGLKSLVTGIVTSIVVLFIVQPYGFLDWGKFLGDFVEQSEMVRGIRDYPYTRQYIDTTPYWYQIRHLSTWGLGWPLGAVAWAGLLFIAIRGLRFSYGMTYLSIGWGVPMAILLVSTDFLAVFIATAVAMVSLLATLPYRSVVSRKGVLLLSWVVPAFLITGAFEVKFLRYLLPITPFLLIFGSEMLMALWDGVGANRFRSTLRPLIAIGMAFMVGSTGFYAFSHLSIYGEPHTAVRAAQWINQNVPKGSIILKEHWEESLPDLGGYHARELRLYDYDGPEKLQKLAADLSTGDYLVLFSNRLYGTIPRLPDRYPFSGHYYRLLFSGQLGYELVKFEVIYPELFGLGFTDDTFRRPGLPEPTKMRAFRSSLLTIDMGFADESYSVYDHPKVMVFQNTAHYDEETIRQLIGKGSRTHAENSQIGEGKSIGLMFSPEDAEAQKMGGTWDDIVKPLGWTNRIPVLAWLVTVEVAALVALPLAFVVFRPLADRGFLFSKALGLLMVGLVVWILASTKWMSFSRESIAVALMLVTLLSVVAIWGRGRELISFVKKQRRVLVVGEVVFLVAFFTFLVLRMANPDLWHPYRGGEKPMDFAYLNAVLRSSYMPPYDPWFGGGYLNYYYWGQFIVSMMIKVTGISPGVAFNLAVPLFFALTVAGSFAVVYNLAEGTLRGVDDSGFNWSPVLAGITAAVFVAVLGNLDGAVQVGQGVWRAMFQNASFGQFDFWRSSRMMPSSLEGITEFPFFTFLFADLHAHLMALPFTLLAIGLALAVVLAPLQRMNVGVVWRLDEILRLAFLGLAVGSLRLLNAWDFPTYLMIAIVAVFLSEFFTHGGLGIVMFLRALSKSVFVFAVGYLVFLPFHLNYEMFFGSLERTTNTTVLWRFLVINGLFIFIMGSFFLIEILDSLKKIWAALRASVRRGDQDVLSDNKRRTARNVFARSGMWVKMLIVIMILAGLIVSFFAVKIAGSTIPFVVALLGIVVVVWLRWLFSWRSDSPHLAFVGLMAAVALALVVGLDIFRIEGDIDRMNSVFKFYLQIWVLLALVSAYLLWRLTCSRLLPEGKWMWGRKVWLTAILLLIASSLVYTVMGTQVRLRDRFNEQFLPLTLDGTAYVQRTTYQDERGEIDLALDFEGIRWLRNNVEGSPIVLEGVTPTYRWGSRVSVYTGLPTVVGWKWHQEQQRWGYRWAVNQRIEDVSRIYRTTSPSEALSLMQKYGVKYVYLGQVEELYYPGPGLEKFDNALSNYLDRVFYTDQVSIYRLKDDGLYRGH